MKKLGRFPIQNCNNIVGEDEIAVYQEDDSLVTGETHCSVIQRFTELGLKKTAGGVRITCQEDCRERKTG